MRPDADLLHRSTQAWEAISRGLPSCGFQLSEAARRCTLDAAPLIEGLAIDCLAASVDLDGEVTVGLWPDAAAGACLPLPTALARSAARQLARLASSTTALVDMLAERWPPSARPERIGIVSDGAGIGFSPDDPCPFRDGWLVRLCLGDTGFAMILPLAERSLARFAPPVSSRPH